MEEETASAHRTPIIVDTLNQNITGSDEVKWLNKKNSELGNIGTQCLMAYLLTKAGLSQLDKWFKEETKEVHSSSNEFSRHMHQTRQQELLCQILG